MATFPKEEIKEVNNLLHKLIGQDFIEENQGEGFLYRKIDEKRLQSFSPEETLAEINKLDDEKFKELYRIVNFYHARWMAYLAIKESNVEYAEFASANELLLALTSIIDRLAKRRRSTSNRKRAFVKFISNNLDEEEIEELIRGAKVMKKGREHELASLNEFARYIYEVRSIVVHEAELTGMYPYGFKFDFENFGAGASMMIRPEIFRKYLWKAILSSLGLNLIEW